jgi:opacity protein-like surface antigen
MEDNMKKALSLLAVLMVAGVAATPVQAATHYVSGFGGISWMNNIKTSDTYQYAAPVNYTTDTDLGSGLAVTGAIGCDYGSYRLEGEVGYQTNGVNSTVYSVDSYTSSSIPLRGDVSVLSLMGNGYYDFDLGSKVDFYATAGVGVAQVSSHNINFDSPNNTDPGWNAHETTLAWQVGAGIAAPVGDNVKLDLRYRYFATTDFTVNAYPLIPFNPYDRNTNVSSHSVLLGLRVEF